MMDTTTGPHASLTAPTDHVERRKLVTRSIAVSPADALDRLGLSEGSADAYLASGEWVPLGRDRVRLVPMASGDPRASVAYALVDTEHDNILVADGINLFSWTARVA